MADDRKQAERRIGLAKLWARAKQVMTTDPSASTASDAERDAEDDVVDTAAAAAMAAQAGRLKGGLAKVAQLAAYDPRASLGGDRGGAAPSAAARAILGALWDRAPAASAGAIAGVVAEDLGAPPHKLFASWDATPLAAASLGQVHAARGHDGTEYVVKVQYPGVADALRADLDDAGFVRKLAGAELGRSLEPAALGALGDAVRGELDYRAEAAALARFAAAWTGDPVIRIPTAVPELSSSRVLTMTRARGQSVVEAAATATSEVRRTAALAIYRFAWGSPLVHRLLNADPNPGNFLIDAEHGTVWCLDFGCTVELPTAVRDADRELWWALLDDDPAEAAERFRMGLARAGLLRRADSLASASHRDWERALAAPLARRTASSFAWTARYAAELADATGRALASGGLALPAAVLLLWRQRLGAASVIGLLDARAPFRAALAEAIGTGKRALR